MSVDDEDDLADVFVTLAGWGYYLDSDNTLKLSPKLKLVSLQVSKGSCPGTYFVLNFSSLSIFTRLSDGMIDNGEGEDHLRINFTSFRVFRSTPKGYVSTYLVRRMWFGLE